jgi:hypothetical protein
MKTLISTAVIMLLCSATAYAQRDAGAKARGDFSFYARSGYSHMNAAHAHASHYHGYLGQTTNVSPRIATLSGSTLSHHLDLAQQHSVAMREHFTKTEDAESIATLDAIDRHLAEAQQHHAAAQAAVKQSPQAPQQAQDHVGKMQDSLDQAMQGQEALINKHGVEKQTVAPPK